MKLERLLSIIIYLLNHKRVSANTLAKKYEVSLRTIQRDIDSLTLAGIPVISYNGINGGYEIMDTYKMQVQLANNKDYSIIIAALKGMNSALLNTDITNTLDKISSLGHFNDSHFILNFDVLKEKDNINKTLSSLEKAIIDKVMISFEYTNARNEKKSYEIEPIAIEYKWYSWYLIGYKKVLKEYRYFKLVRIENIKQLNYAINDFHHSATDIIKEHFSNDTREYYNIKILCKKTSKIKAIEYLNGIIISTQENGDYIMNLHLPKTELLWKATLISLGDSITILEPDEVRIELINICKNFLNI